MSETNPAHPWTGELTAAGLDLLGAEPLRRSDPVTIGPYRVLARLGGGGMGRLYLGREAAVEEQGAAAYGAGALAAVKVIRSEHAEDERFRRRFEREVEAVRRVHGRYTAELLGSGFDEEEHLWMATSYVPGLGLDEAVRRFGPLPGPVVWRLAAEIGEALATIAATGIVHRDLKPSNVLLGADGARVIDFGVAHATGGSMLTMTGQQVGTPAFMSPEQAEGGEVGTASDVFSLGSVLAYATTGRAPFGEGSPGGVIHRVIYSPPSEQTLAQLNECDPGLAELAGRCLKKSPDDRPSPEEVADIARKHAPAAEWSAPIAELVASRAEWRGQAVAVSPMEHLTVLRRGPLDRRVRQAAPKRRRLALVLGTAAAAVVVAGAVVALAMQVWGSTHDGRHEKAVAATAPQKPPARPTAPQETSPSAPAPKSTSPEPSTSRSPGEGPGVQTPGPGIPGEAPPTRVYTVAPEEPKPSPPSKPRKPGKPSKPWRSCAYYSGTALTDYGDKGNRVRQVQCILKARGYNIGSSGVDGDFGRDTRGAVMRFQRYHHLDVDGQVGVDTWPALRG